MQPFSRYNRALSRMGANTSAHERSQKIDAMVTQRLLDIHPGDLVRYASDWPVLRVISVSPKRIETKNDAGQVITFNGVESVAPGIRLHDPVTVADRLHKVGG
jgi:predicted TIM-barrel fold metal-dependent hydrolase